ncbi:hypothetical protein PO002_15175 [Cupriavidus necator]|uniref:hypothetical protein n=1 Tax=Cupriavidus necator TaxID=106590 RepID=UPI0039C1FDE9
MSSKPYLNGITVITEEFNRARPPACLRGGMRLPLGSQRPAFFEFPPRAALGAL